MTGSFGRGCSSPTGRLRLLAVASVVLAPLAGSTSMSFAPRVRSVGSVCRQRGRADLLRRAAAAHAGRRAGRRRRWPAAGVVFQGLLRNPLATPFTLGVSAGAALGAMLAITFGWSLGLAWPAGCAPLASFAGSLGAVAIVYVLAQRAASRPLDQRAAARRRDDERVLLGADPVRPVLRRFRRDLSHPALADGRPRRQQLQPLIAALPLVVVSFAIFAWLARPLNLLSLGPDARRAAAST